MRNRREVEGAGTKKSYTAAVLGDQSDGEQNVSNFWPFKGKQRCPSERQLVPQKAHRLYEPIYLVWWGHRMSWKLEKELSV